MAGNKREDLIAYLTDKLKMDKELAEEIPVVSIQRILDRENKCKDEAVVYFEDKQDRDAVKARASNLANYTDAEEGMRL